MHIGAFFLSLFLPGGGQFLLGRYLRGALIWPLPAAGYLLLPVLGLWALAVTAFVHAAAALDTIWLRERPVTALVALPCVALFALNVGGALGLRAFYIEAFKIPGGSMAPTLEEGDHIFVAKYDRSAARGDVVVFRYPPDPTKDFVKRVVAVGGDTVEVRGQQLIVNRQPMIYPVSVDPGYASRDFPDEAGAFAVPEGRVFVLGDNRGNSHDSRYWGTVPLEDIKGRVLFIWWSKGSRGARCDRIGRWIR